MMEAALFSGTVAHRRFIPVDHAFQYPFFMWFFNLDRLDQLPSLTPWFSATGWAVSRFCRSDYYGDAHLALADSIRQRMFELTGEKVQGEICGLVNLRTLGLYFSPVNFYFGYDDRQMLTHFLAEVSNTPWNERHQYGYYLQESGMEMENDKEFHVSPFNHRDQHYSWKITTPGDRITLQLAVADTRGKVFQANLNLTKSELNKKNVMKQLRSKPMMTMTIIRRIYWQALKLFVKGVPYVPYRKEAA
jgi:DUF1365 family protein